MSPVREQVRAQVRAILAGYAGGRALPEDADLPAAGLDSVDLLEFFAELESSFKITFQEGDIDLANLSTIEDVAQLVEKRMH